MIEELKKLITEISELNKFQRFNLVVIKLYLNLMRNAFQKINSINYINQFVYFSILQLCSQIHTVDSNSKINLFYFLLRNSHTISSCNKTIMTVENLIYNNNFLLKLLNSQEIIPMKSPLILEELCEKQITSITPQPVTSINQGCSPEVIPSLINFDVLSHYRNGIL